MAWSEPVTVTHCGEFTVTWFYQGMTRYIVKKDGVVIYDGFSQGDVERIIGEPLE